jgi:hypothetical protein
MAVWLVSKPVNGGVLGSIEAQHDVRLDRAIVDAEEIVGTGAVGFREPPIGQRLIVCRRCNVGGGNPADNVAGTVARTA